MFSYGFVFFRLFVAWVLFSCRFFVCVFFGPFFCWSCFWLADARTGGREESGEEEKRRRVKTPERETTNRKGGRNGGKGGTHRDM